MNHTKKRGSLRPILVGATYGAILFAGLTLTSIFLLNDIGLGFFLCIPAGALMRITTLDTYLKNEQFNRCIVIGAPIVNALLGAVFGSIAGFLQLLKKENREK